MIINAGQVVPITEIDHRHTCFPESDAGLADGGGDGVGNEGHCIEASPEPYPDAAVGGGFHPIEERPSTGPFDERAETRAHCSGAENEAKPLAKYGRLAFKLIPEIS